MKSRKILIAIAVVGGLAASIAYAADHIDAPAVTGKSTDITDMYVFQGQNTSNLVFVANTQGLMSPSATSTASFDANSMIEFNIDNNNDNVEDLVIQCVFNDGKMVVYGPVKPGTTGLNSTVTGAAALSVGVTPYSSTSPITATASGITAFAGPRDDPFYFDLDQYLKIIGGTATAFKPVGVDAFKGTNVMSVVVEVPKSLLNATIGQKLNVWVESKKKI
jgi:hypothetical protein